ncbi:MAG: YDG domain-containing protein [Clostridia bacterium]
MISNKLRKNLIIALISVMTILCLGLFNMPEMTAYAVGEDVKESYYLYDETKPNKAYKSDVVAGTTVGYDKYELTKPASLKTKANLGFEIKGWLISYKLKGSESVTTEFITDDKTIVEGTKNVLLDITNTDTDLDGRYDESILDVASVFADMSVEPVFDYIYYSVELGNMMNFINLSNYTADTIGENLLYHKDATYQNSILKTVGNDYYYVGNVTKSGEDYLNAYGKELTEYSFRYNDEVKFDLDVDVDNSKYIQANKFLVETLDRSIPLGIPQNSRSKQEISSTITNLEGVYYSTNLAIDFEIMNSDDQNNLLIMDYTPLYKLTINPQIITRYKNAHELGSDTIYPDVYELANGTRFIINNQNKREDIVFGDIQGHKIERDDLVGRSDLIKLVTIGDAFYNFNNGEYLIKSGETPTITVNNYSKISANDQKSYTFYDYILTNNGEDIGAFYSDRTIDIYHAPTVYNVQYAFRVYNAGVLSAIAGDHNVLATAYYKRGQEIQLLAVDAPNNIGYSFQGYYYKNGSKIQQKVSILSDQPSNQMVYMAYQPITYEIHIQDMSYDTILNNGANDIRALSKVVFTKNGSRQDYDADYSVATKIADIKIGDNFSIEAIVNDGFVFDKFMIDSNEYTNNYEFTFDEELISYTTGTIKKILTIQCYEYCETYDFTYYIDKSELTDVDTGAKTEYLMANISVNRVPAYARVERIDIQGNTIATTDNDTLAQKIIISGLHLYDTIQLDSTPLELEDKPGVYYMYHNFTAGDLGLSQLSDIIDETNRLYSHKPTIRLGVGSYLQAKVIYSMPMSGLVISGHAGILPEVLVTYADGTIITKDDSFQLDTYKFTVDEGTGLADIKIIFDMDQIAFGYIYRNSTLSRYTDTDITDAKDGVIAFTVTSGRIYNLNLNFDLVEYVFNLTNNLDSTSVSETLTVEDMSISLDKPEGYYISKFTHGEIDVESGYGLNESNASNAELDNHIYSRAFTSVDTFKNFIISYDSDNDNEINLNIVYEIYKYDIKVQFSILNATNSIFEEIMSYPELETVCTLLGEDVTFITADENKVVTYSAIPYGADLDILVHLESVVGFDYNRWIGGATGDRDSILLENITNNYTLVYELKYIEYELVLQMNDSDQGSPKVKINDVTIKADKECNISMFDRLSISANPNTEDGFTFKNIFVDYLYTDADSFKEVYNQLYIRSLDTGVYTLNTSDVYDSNLQYVRALETIEGEYDESNFDASRYVKSAENKIYVYLDYDLKRVVILPEYSFNSDDLEGGATLRSGEENELNTSINIPISDVASFIVYATSTLTGSDGSERVVAEGDTVNYYDNIRIVIDINDNALDQISGRRFNLKGHVTVAKVISIAGKRYSIKDQGNGVYEISTTMKSLMKKNAASFGDSIYVEYSYEVKNCTLELTANIGDESFYSNIKMDITLSGYGFGFQNDSNSGAVAYSDALQFLGAGMMSYTWNNNYAEYFKIYRTNIYLDGELLDRDSEEYRNMIYITYYEDGSIQMIEFIRVVGDLKVELIMQPIIWIKQGNEYVVVTDAEYSIPKIFICDNTGSAIEQSVIIGEYGSNTADVKMAKIVADAVETIEYRDESNMLVSPKNVGNYTAVIKFKNSDEYAWLAELNGKLLCTIKLQITPKPLSITYDATKVEKEEKTYDQSHAYEDMKKLTNYLVFEFVDNTGATVKMPYYGGIFKLDSTNFTKMANITHTVDDVEENIATANENTHYNILIKNMAISNNNNFTLINKEVVIYDIIRINKRLLTIEGLNVNDKVYDSTTDATLSDSEITLHNIVGTDDVSLNKSKVSLSFADANIGKNKVVNIDPTLALKGLQSENYKINTMQISTATIYPYSVSMELEGIGLITLRNDRGLLDSQYASLIPVDARLTVSIITDSHDEYNDIRGKISSHLSRMKVYGYSYKLQLDVMGNHRDIDNHLYLVMPKPESMKSLLWVNNDTSGVLTFNAEEDPVIIDLIDVEGSIRYAVVIENRNLLTWWQILLIVLLVLVVVGLIVTVFLVIRRKKIREYELKEKI